MPVIIPGAYFAHGGWSFRYGDQDFGTTMVGCRTPMLITVSGQARSTLDLTVR